METKTLDRPLAKIENIALRKDETSFLLTVDYSTGMGSYAGLTSEILEVRGGHVQWINAINASTKKPEPIRVAKALKHGWKLAPAATAKDILAISCHPEDAGNDFVVEYVRYHFDGEQWLKYERVKKGLWESDEAFPPRALFP